MMISLNSTGNRLGLNSVMKIKGGGYLQENEVKKFWVLEFLWGGGGAMVAYLIADIY